MLYLLLVCVPQTNVDCSERARVVCSNDYHPYKKGGLEMNFDSIGAATLQNIENRRVIGSGRWRASLDKLGDRTWGTNQNMCRGAQKTAIGRTIGSFEQNGPRRGK